MTNDKIEEEILKKSLEGIKINNFMIVKGHVQTAISLIKAEYKKEINDLKEELKKKQKHYDELYQIRIDDLKFQEEQTSKKVEELIDKIDKELRHNVIEFELNDVPCCVKDVKVMHDFLINLKDELFSPQNHIPQREEFSAVKKNGCSNNSSSPEEDLK